MNKKYYFKRSSDEFFTEHAMEKPAKRQSELEQTTL